jgi:malate/lactate dehydrogenase
MGLMSDGQLYSIPEGIVYSFPVTIKAGGEVTVVQGREISDFSREKMDITAKELVEERDIATQFLQVSTANGEGKL